MSIAIKEFEKIAESNGKQISISPNPDQEIDHVITRLNMEMIELSIRHAQENTETAIVRDRLDYLLKNGTDAQKIELVIGEGRYYFPQDLEVMARKLRNGDATALENCYPECEVVCWTCCCGWSASKPDEIRCHEHCRTICYMVCD